MKLLKSKIINTKTLVVIFISVAALTIISAVSELQQSKKEMINLMQNQAHSLIETILVSSEEVLYAADEVEDEINKRLLNNSEVINILLEQNRISNSILTEIAKKNGLFRINIFSKTGELLFTGSQNAEFKTPPKEKLMEYLSPIFSGQTDTLLLGLKKSEMSAEYRYVVATAGKNNSAIVLLLKPDDLLEFRRRIGFGILMRRLAENSGVVYTALESEYGILAASNNVDSLETIDESEFLTNSLKDSAFVWRFYNFKGEDVFEAAHPFAIDGQVIGVLRIGLNLKPLNAINDRIKNRIITIAIILFFFGSIIILLVFVRQNLDLMKKQYSSIETFSNKLIQSVSDAIIVIDPEEKIKVINQAAERLFGVKEENAIGKEAVEILSDDNCVESFSENSAVQEISCNINGGKKILLVSKSKFTDENKNENTVLIIKDLTELKELEKQLARNDRLKAMGELASGVAHEIRNPLNAIGTIIQQLDKDFAPAENADEYHSLARLVYKEVKRINETVNEFLRFSKPEPIKKSDFRLNETLKELEAQFAALLEQKGIELKILSGYEGTVNWDRNQIKQTLVNLIQNAAQAIKGNGVIKLAAREENGNIILSVEDNGAGIPEENLGRIFNLYFTTKAEGTGIGLSVTQRIIQEHDGIITVESKVGEGTVFTIKLPSGL